MFDNVSIGIKTFIRDEQLFHAIHGIEQNLPGAQMIIADCGDMTEEKDGLYADLGRRGHIHIDLPFDSGFGMMSNSIVDRLTRPYILIASDDFDFTSAAAEGVKALQEVLDYCPDIDIASGRVNGNPYEFYLEERYGRVVEKSIWENSVRIPETWYADCDLTVNYSLIRQEVFEEVSWDNNVRIGGGEHAAFFLDCKHTGFKTVYVTGVNINEQKVRNSPRYQQYRNRARSPERPCFVKRGIQEYVLGNGQIDYKEQ